MRTAPVAEDDEKSCEKCGNGFVHVHCESCADGYVGHDCGEDCCPCLNPEDNVPCDVCDGHGFWLQCECGHFSADEYPLPVETEIVEGAK